MDPVLRHNPLGMKNTKQIFHVLSYIQYPLMLVVLYFYIQVLISMGTGETDWSALNNALIFLGIQVGFSTLQDTSKVQNKVSRSVWESPRKGTIAIGVITALIILFLISGLIGFFSSRDTIHKEISFGLIVLGIGLIGMLKGAIEMFENHRKDRKTTQGS